MFTTLLISRVISESLNTVVLVLIGFSVFLHHCFLRVTVSFVMYIRCEGVKGRS